MRRTHLIAALLAVTVPTMGRAADADADAEKAIARLSEQFTDALVKGDLTFLDGVMADDWMVIATNGKSVDKALQLKDLKDGTVKFDAMDKSEMKIRVY